MKKIRYIKPEVKVISLCCSNHLVNGTNLTLEAEQKDMTSRESSIWDEEEEEEDNLGGWFK